MDQEYDMHYQNLLERFNDVEEKLEKEKEDNENLTNQLVQAQGVLFEANTKVGRLLTSIHKYVGRAICYSKGQQNIALYGYETWDSSNERIREYYKHQGEMESALKMLQYILKEVNPQEPGKDSPEDYEYVLQEIEKGKDIGRILESMGHKDIKGVWKD